LRNWTF